jgi:hypothetical protein
MFSKLEAIVVVTGVLITAPAAQAAVVYDNGPVNGTVNAWTINYGYVVANSFALSDSWVLTGANFGLWNLPGDVTATIDWSIVEDPTAGPVLASGTATVSQGFQFTNGYGYDVNLDSITLPNIALEPGTYWFQLQNADVTNGDAAYWDINGGPSEVWGNGVGYNPDPLDYAPGLSSASDSFQLVATTVPEPGSFLLIGSGLVGFVWRRRSKGLGKDISPERS